MHPCFTAGPQLWLGPAAGQPAVCLLIASLDVRCCRALLLRAMIQECSTKGFSLWVAYSAGQLTDACPLLQTVGSLQPNSVLS
eukprot:COSAG01_NODE_48078_length_384_cov_0.870175_1_plen_82_part_10